MKLHNYWRSSSSYRVRIALAWKGLPYEYVAVNLLEGEQRSDAYRAVSPMGQVPCLELEDGRRLGQSLAIIDHLERLEPAPPLYPADPYLRAKAFELAEIINSGIQPLQNMEVQVAVKQLGGDGKAWAARFIARGLAALEAAASQVGGRFLVGDEVSIAEVCLIPQLYGARRLDVDLEAYPRLLRVEAACLPLAPFEAAHPARQPDAVPAPRAP